MPEVAQSQLARGMRDLLPAEMRRVRRIEDAFTRTCLRWGYGEIRTPVIEPIHLFTAAGTLSPQTLDRVYSFLDWDGWSGERVVLRPDSTIPAARLYAERFPPGSVARLFYRQDIFRFAEDDSAREEWQCGVELMGETGRRGDIELIFLALDALAEAGAAGVVVRLSHAGIVRAVLAAAGMPAEEQAAAYDRLLDGDARVVDEIEARLPQLNAPLRLLFDVDGAGSGYIANIRAALAAEIPGLTPALDELAAVVAALEARGVAPRISAALARRFEYYSGIVMRFERDGRRIGGGGRYDELIALVGGRRVPASGFALDIGALLDATAAGDDERAVRISVTAEADSPEMIAAAYDCAAELRRAGFAVDTIDEGRDGTPCVVCRPSRPRFVLRHGGSERTFEGAAELMAALEHVR
jgi:histidyl-tRNA synthetase